MTSTVTAALLTLALFLVVLSESETLRPIGGGNLEDLRSVGKRHGRYWLCPPLVCDFNVLSRNVNVQKKVFRLVQRRRMVEDEEQRRNWAMQQDLLW